MNTFDKTNRNLSHAKMLVVEDNADYWLLIKKSLEQVLPEVKPVLAQTPEQALDLLNEWSLQEWELPKLILQDLYLPTREDGWQLLKKIKQLPSACSRIPVVILSSSSSRADIEEAYQFGSASYLVKPVDFPGWINFFGELRTYWWETVSLPPVHFSL
ncbi:response regulator [Spirosoma profusum]|nr:response regulator [Spirosoma profusum]